MTRSARAADASARAQAAAWLARLRSEARTPTDEAAFHAWLGEGERNRRAFDTLTAAWEMAGAAAASPAPASARIGRRAALAGAAGLALAAGVGGFAAWNRGEEIQTRLGEQRRVRLTDGSLLLLDTSSQAKVSVKGAVRRVEILRGRSHMKVAKDPGRPFEVEMGGVRVVALGTEFEVSREGGARSVLLLEGSVRVEGGPPGAARVRRILSPGDRIVFDQGGRVARADRPSLRAATAWQDGRMVLDDQPLSDALAEINRYNPRPLVATDPAIAQLRISGVYRTEDAEAFATSLAAILPLTVIREPNRLVLAARPSAEQNR